MVTENKDNETAKNDNIITKENYYALKFKLMQHEAPIHYHEYYKNFEEEIRAFEAGYQSVVDLYQDKDYLLSKDYENKVSETKAMRCRDFYDVAKGYKFSSNDKFVISPYNKLQVSSVPTQSIAIFDWDGNPQKLINTNQRIMVATITDFDIIYALVETDLGYAIAKINA